MVALRYESSPLMLKNNLLVRCAHSRNIFKLSKRNFASPRGHVILFFFIDLMFLPNARSP